MDNTIVMQGIVNMVVYGGIFAVGLRFINDEARKLRWQGWLLVFVVFHTQPPQVGAAMVVFGWFIHEATFLMLRAKTPPKESG